MAWVTATPRVAATGAATTVRLAGGGDVAPYYRGGNHYRAGIVTLPRYRAQLGFDENGWTGGTVPQTGNIIFKPGQPSLADELAALYWMDAPITVETGLEGGAVAVELTGTVASVAVVDGALVIELADLSKALDKPVVTARFAGTGGAEGGGEAKGRVKRRSWGRVFNIEGRILDKANNVFEFGDPAFPWQQWDVLRDKGRAAAPAPAVLAWQGSVAATLTALKASAPAQGSGVVAPSIACAKWWTQPAGPLTADVRGEIGTGYVETAPEIAARISTVAGGPGFANAGTMAALRAGAAGLHIGDENETAAEALDRLLGGVSLLWVLEATGSIRLREWTFGAPVETVIARSVSRRRSFPPVETRRLGYQRAHRIHSDGEIAAVLLIEDVDGLQGELDAKSATFFQDDVPTADRIGDTWIRPSDNPRVLKAWDGDSWERVANDVTQGTHIGVENGADVTSQIDGPKTITVKCDHLGTPKAGELNATFPFKLVRNGVVVTAGVSWSTQITSGKRNNADAGPTFYNANAFVVNGVLNEPLFSFETDESRSTFKATYAGTVRTLEVLFRKEKDPPPGSSGAGGGTGGTGTGNSASVNHVNGVTSYPGTASAGPITCKSGSGGVVNITASLTFGASVNANRHGWGKVQFSTDGSSWSDVEAETLSQQPWTSYDDAEGLPVQQDGVLNIEAQKTGLDTSGATTYHFRLCLRNNSVGTTLYFTGTFGIQGA